MKTLHLEIDDGAYAKIVDLLQLIPQCRIIASDADMGIEEIPNQLTRQVIKDARAGKNMEAMSLERLKEIADA